jgi:hypothetical protein
MWFRLACAGTIVGRTDPGFAPGELRRMYDAQTTTAYPLRATKLPRKSANAQLPTRVQDWPYSTFHSLVSDGTYPLDWGGDVASELAYDD